MMRMFFIMSLLGCTVTLYLYIHFLFLFSKSFKFLRLKKLLGLLFFILIAFVPFITQPSLEFNFFNIYPIFKNTLYFIYVESFILFLLFVILDFFTLVLKFSIFKISKFSWVRTSWILFILSIFISIYALYSGTSIPNLHTLDISSSKIKESKNIVVLADIHMNHNISLDKVKNIVSKTNSYSPDLILLVGDIIDDNPDNIKDFLEVLKKLKSKDGVYFVGGNHEYINGNERTIQALKDLGFIYLMNSGVNIYNDLYVGGVPDDTIYRRTRFNSEAPDPKKALQNSLSSQYSILLSHSPMRIENQSNLDLEISGHTHGGQLFPMHFPIKYFNYGYLKGLYNMGSSKIFVSSGAGQWGPQMRLLSPSEIVLIKLKPKS